MVMVVASSINHYLHEIKKHHLEPQGMLMIAASSERIVTKSLIPLPMQSHCVFVNIMCEFLSFFKCYKVLFLI